MSVREETFQILEVFMKLFKRSRNASRHHCPYPFKSGNIDLGQLVRFSTALAFLILTPSQTYAASFSKADLILEGLSQTMADILEFDLYLAEGEQKATVEVRGFTLSGDDLEIITPIKASNLGNTRDDEGNYLNTTECVRQDRKGNPLPGLRPIILHNGFYLLYRNMSLPEGVHKVAFEMKAYVNGVETATVRTPISEVTITKEARKKSRFALWRTIKEGEEIRPDETVNEEPDPKNPGKNRRVGKYMVYFDLENPLEGGWYRKKIDSWDTGIVRVLENIADVRNGPFTDADLELVLPGADEIAPAPELVDEPSNLGHLLFATNRNLLDDTKFIYNSSRYGTEPSELRTGSTFLHIPVEAHEMGRLEQPGRGEDPDPKKHFIVSSLYESPEKEFYKKEIHDRIGYGSRDILLYVHGFNNDMNFASLRFMQLVHDLRFQGLPIAFIWPSEGSGTVSAYKRDEQRAAMSAAPLADFLVQMVEQHAKAKVPGKIHLLAHSMGNRVLLNALHLARDRISRNFGDAYKPFSNVMLVAADVDIVDFNALIPSTVELSDAVWNYHCAEDKALMFSRGLHVAKRLGEQAVFERGVIDIDARKANTGLIGHDYYVTHTPLLYDIAMLIRGTPLADRVTIKRKVTNGLFEYVFP